MAVLVLGPLICGAHISGPAGSCHTERAWDPIAIEFRDLKEAVWYEPAGRPLEGDSGFLAVDTMFPRLQLVPGF